VNEEIVVMIAVFSIPMVAIVGGIVAGIVKSLGQQRLAELAQRERMLAIEKGIPPDQLPPLALPAALGDAGLTFEQSQLRRAQGLTIGGIICVAVGLAIMIFLQHIPDGRDKQLWVVGVIPLFVGLALLISAWIVRPRKGDSRGLS
jgi:hypothetical protein